MTVSLNIKRRNISAFQRALAAAEAWAMAEREGAVQWRLRKRRPIGRYRRHPAISKKSTSVSVVIAYFPVDRSLTTSPTFAVAWRWASSRRCAYLLVVAA
jgi:hypothetical protein